MHDAGALAEEFAATGHAWAQGDVALPHVRLLLDFASALPHERRGEFEAAALEKARSMTPPAFRRALRRLVERFHPIPLSVRHDAARAERRLYVEQLDDGMAWVNLLCEAERALAIDAHVRALTVNTAAGDERTRGQRAADCAVALLLGGAAPADQSSGNTSAATTPGDAAASLGNAAAATLGGGTTTAAPPFLARGSFGAVRPTVHVTVPVLSLLGSGDEPAILGGYGPISIETAGADGVVRWKSPVGSVRESLPAHEMRPPPKDAASRMRRAEPPPAIGA